MTEQEIQALYRRLIQGKMREDIIVVEDNHRTPVLGEEYLMDYIYIGLCVCGSSRGQYDYQDYCFCAGDICWLLPNHVIRHDEVSDDYHVLSIFVNKSYYQKLNAQGLLPRHYYPFFLHSLSLDPQQFDMMYNGFLMMGRLADLHHPRRDELVCKMLDVLAILCDEFIMQQKPDIALQQKHFIKLFEHFYIDVVRHYSQSHEVSYYARLQSLTPKYFSTVVKMTTGQSALQWINNYVMVQAKWMLQHEHDRTVQQIAHQLGFSEQASFSRFFKTNSGKSPTEFRDMV